MYLKNIVLLISLLKFVSCDKDKVQSHKQNKDKIDFGYKIVKFLSTGTNEPSDTLRLEVIQDEKKNLLILLKDKTGVLLTATGASYSNIYKGDDVNFVVHCQLNKDPLPEFVVRTYTIGSTYGAEKYYVIWGYFDDIKYQWNLTPLELQRPTIEDRNKDGVFEIIEYYGQNKNGLAYYFEDGKLISCSGCSE